MKAVKHDNIQTYQEFKETILWFYTTIGKGVPKAFVEWIANDESDDVLKDIFRDWDYICKEHNSKRDYTSISYQCIELSY